MKEEMELVRQHIGEVAQEATPITRLHCRKMINEAANGLVHEGLLINNFEALVGRVLPLIRSTASTMVVLNLEPDTEDFVYAACELVAVIRKSMDDAIKLSNAADTRISGVMFEILARGICATLSLPYSELLHAETPEAIREILTASGHLSCES